MIVLDLNVDVLGNTRFAFSPLSELACSVSALTCAGRSDPHAAWARWARPRVGHVDVPLLQAVHPPGRWAPDFLFPDVDGPDVSLDDQLDALAEVDDGEVEEELTGVWDQRPLPEVARRALDGPLRFGEVLATELRTYWDAALAPHWPRVRGALEEDVAHRAGQTLRGGLFDLLADLHHEVSVDGAVLRIDKPHHDDVTLPGRPPHARPRRLHLAAPAARPLLPRRVPAHLPGARASGGCGRGSPASAHRATTSARCSAVPVPPS